MQFFRRYGFFILSLAAVLLPFMFYTSEISMRQDASMAEKVIYIVINPVHSAVSKTTNSLASVWSNYLNLVKAREEAILIKEENSRLNVKLQLLSEIRLENERLRKLLHFIKDLGPHFLSGSVQTGDPSFLYTTLRLNRGESDGVKPGMGVVSSQGVVGFVMRSFANNCDVLLVVDRNSDMDVIVSRNRRRGIVQGYEGDRLKFKYLEKGSRIQIGDEVLTSGLTGVFPRGIHVGQVSKIVYEADGLTQLIEVEPAVEFSSLSEALILTKPSYEMDIIQKVGGTDWMKNMEAKLSKTGG